MPAPHSDPDRWRVGIDTGGTFTDLVAISSRGEVRLRKVSSTPDDPSRAVFEALERSAVDLAAELDALVLGTTIATNAVIERAGAQTIFVTTAGFEDNLYIQRIDRRGLYDLQWRKAPPYALRSDTIGVAERILADGTVRTRLRDAEVERVLAAVGDRIRAADGSVAIAVSLLFAYVEAAHETRLAAALRAAFPDVPVSVSSEVAPIWREYERASTVVIDAYVRPMVGAFVDRLDDGLRSRHAGGRHALLKSNGGQVPLGHAAERPIDLVLSGLAGGMIAGAWWSARAGSTRAVTLDMGGTSADVGVVVDGSLRFTGLFEVEWGVPIALPIIDVATIGAGGSSIASVDFGGLLRVGPESAGAAPGPAAYGRGGTSPTVTDANLVMGRLDPGFFLGGSLPLDAGLALAAVETIAADLDRTAASAADAIVRVAVENMAGAIRLVTVDRGYDYRDFDLVAFGGAGPLHAAEISRRLGMRRAIVPPSPGLVSALGALLADDRIDRRATVVHRLDRPEAAALGPRIREMMAEAVQALVALRGQVDRPVTVTASVACRYLGQNYEQEVRIADGHLDRSFELALPVDPADDRLVDRLVTRFHEVHRDRYGYDLPDQPVQSVYVTVTAISAAPPVVFVPSEVAAGEPVVREILVDGTTWVPAAIVRREALPIASTVAGPAIIEERDSTTFVPPGFTAHVDPSWCLVLIDAHRPAADRRSDAAAIGSSGVAS